MAFSTRAAAAKSAMSTSTTIEQFIQAVDSYIRWYNEQRIKISLDSLSPIEYRESLGLTA
jgi:transposase InsO family protein